MENNETSAPMRCEKCPTELEVASEYICFPCKRKMAIELDKLEREFKGMVDFADWYLKEGNTLIAEELRESEQK